MRIEGTFVTRKSSGEVVVSHNRFTAEGLAYLWDAILGDRRGRLNEAMIAVGNGSAPNAFTDSGLRGDEVERRALDEGFPRVDGWMTIDDAPHYRVVFQATFGALEANFDWRERGVIAPDGVLIDRAVSDQGSKVVGAIWTAEVMLDMIL